MFIKLLLGENGNFNFLKTNNMFGYVCNSFYMCLAQAVSLKIYYGLY